MLCLHHSTHVYANLTESVRMHTRVGFHGKDRRPTHLESRIDPMIAMMSKAVNDAPRTWNLGLIHDCNDILSRIQSCKCYVCISNKRTYVYANLTESVRMHTHVGFG